MSSLQRANATSFLHISDPHLTRPEGVFWRQLLSKRILGYLSWRQRRRHEHRPEVLDRLCAVVRDLEAQQIVVSGDLTQIGLPEEFEQAANWLKILGPAEKVVVCPGNHDSYVTSEWASSYRHWLPYLEGDQPAEPPCDRLSDIFPSLRVRGQVAFIGLSSAIPTAPFRATGHIGHEQRRELGRLLHSTGERGLFRVLFLHHPLSMCGEKRHKRLVDATELEAVLDEHGAELVLHGHRHRNIERSVQAAGRTVPVIGVASASARGRHAAPASFCRFTVAMASTGEVDPGWVLDMEWWAWDEGVADFRQVSTHRSRIPAPDSSRQEDPAP